MKTSKKITPEIQMKAEEYINLGYQRLLTFEVGSGGFSWFGESPANKLLTGWGLMEFYDMSKVHNVDPNIILRTHRWMLSKQNADGSWSPDSNAPHSWSKIPNSNLLVTAYITWAMLDSGFKGEQINKAINYIRTHINEAQDAYTLALIANALVSYDKNDDATYNVFQKLVDMKISEKDIVKWKSSVESITNSYGNSADVETSALIAYAMIKSGRYSEIVNKTLTFLIRSKDGYGNFGSTQATILSLRALVSAMKTATSEVNANITVNINGKDIETLQITPQNSDVMRLVDLKEYTKEGDNQVKLKFSGKGSALYQIVGRYYLQWTDEDKRKKEPLTITVAYDKTELEKDDIVTSKVSIMNNTPLVANMVIVDLGIPPGFDVEAGDIAELVGNKTISKFQMTSRQAILYFETLQPNQKVEFSYRLKAKFPIKAKTRLSRIYKYYNPEEESFAQPVEMVVK